MTMLMLAPQVLDLDHNRLPASSAGLLLSCLSSGCPGLSSLSLQHTPLALHAYPSNHHYRRAVRRRATTGNNTSCCLPLSPPSSMTNGPCSLL